MQVAPRTANTIKNLERQQWQTTYDLQHTGLGASGPMQLDNYDQKYDNMLLKGMQDDALVSAPCPRRYVQIWNVCEKETFAWFYNLFCNLIFCS